METIKAAKVTTTISNLKNAKPATVTRYRKSKTTLRSR